MAARFTTDYFDDDVTWGWLSDVTSAPMGVLIVLFLFVSVSLGIMFNLVMARTAFLYRKKSKYKTTAHLLITLGIVDFSYSSSQGVQIISYYLSGKNLTSSCDWMAMFGLFLVIAEQLLYCWLIVERVNSVYRPLSHYVECPGRKVWLDILMILSTSLVISVLLCQLAGAEFNHYRGRCWVKRAPPSHHTLFLALLSCSSLLPLLLTLALVSRLVCLPHPTNRALPTLACMTLVYVLSAYSELSILLLSGSPGSGTARRYLLALDSIVTLLSRALSPVTYSYSLRDFTFFCLGYVDERMVRPLVTRVTWLPGYMVTRVAKVAATVAGEWRSKRMRLTNRLGNFTSLPQAEEAGNQETEDL